MSKKSDDNKQLKRQFSLFVSELLDASGDKGYKKFLFFLIMIDLAWFGSVVADNLLGWKLGDYGEFAWIFLFSLGLIVISNVKRIRKIPTQGFRSESFASLATFTIGILALITAVLSLPTFKITNPVFSAIKGILALLAIIYVILEAWVIKEH